MLFCSRVRKLGEIVYSLGVPKHFPIEELRQKGGVSGDYTSVYLQHKCLQFFLMNCRFLIPV